MRRSINSTGRKRITSENVSFFVRRDGSGNHVDFRADVGGLSHLGLPAAAAIIVEPYYKHSSMRFEFGTVGSPLKPERLALNEIDQGGDILFRVKVVDEHAAVTGRLLAAGDQISARVPDDQDATAPSPLLPIRFRNLGERIWDLSIEGEKRPHLLVNSSLPDLSARIQEDPVLQGAILPEAFKQILFALKEGKDGDLPWAESWQEFIQVELGQPLDDIQSYEDEAWEALVDDVLESFCTKHKFATRAKPADIKVEVAYD